MATGSSRIRAFIIAKNEEQNIKRALQSLDSIGVPITILDSGSTDGTQAICSTYAKALVRSYEYRAHWATYNDITLGLPASDYALVLDADMVVSQALFQELDSLADQGMHAVVRAPVEMWWESMRMPFGSLYPPKPVLFRGGREYFVSSGHDDRLDPSLDDPPMTRNSLIHDDRKGFDAYVASQLRYTRNMLRNAENGRLSRKDVLYLNSPLMMIIQPIYSYIVKGGFLCGRAGLLYALDRLLATTIAYRQAIALRCAKTRAGRGDM
jgi:glycosyltransferase involved in cell wall biosynthesis